MFWRKHTGGSSNRRAGLVGLVMAVGFGLMALSSPARAGEVIVLDSTITAFAPGVSLPSNAYVNIPEGGALSVMDASGQTRTLRGPYSGSVAADAPPSEQGGVMSILGQLVKEDQRERTQLGAVRAFSKSDVLRDPMAIDVSRNTTFCMPPQASPKFWRPEALDKDTRFSIRDWASSNEPLVAYWKKGDRELAWPPVLNVSDGATYLMKVEAARAAAEVTILQVPQHVSGELETIVWMAQHGCRDQARRMVGSLRDGESTSQ